MQNAYSEPTTSAQAIIDDLNAFPASELFNLEQLDDQRKGLLMDFVAGETNHEQYHLQLQSIYFTENHGDKFDFYTEIAPFLFSDEIKSNPKPSLFGDVGLGSLSVRKGI